MSIFNKPYKTDEELMEDKNVSEFIRQRLEDNGTITRKKNGEITGGITIDEVLEHLGKESNFENRMLARQAIISRSVKGKLEKEGKTLSCDNGRYFIVEDDKDAENEAIRRKNNTLGYLNTAKRAFNNLEETNPAYIDKILQASHEILAKALEFKIKITKQLKG